MRSQHAICTANGIVHDEQYLVRCFICGLDTNYDYTRDLLSNNALSWYSKDLNDVVQLAKDVKLTCESSGEWITVSGSTKSIGKQGPKRPDDDNATVATDNDSNSEDSFLTKPSNLSCKEVQKLLKKFSCAICRSNNHPLHKCRHLNNVYNITFKTDPTAVPPTNPSPAAAPSTNQSTGSAGHVSMLPIVLRTTLHITMVLKTSKTSPTNKLTIK